MSRLFPTLREVSNFSQAEKPVTHRSLPAPTLDSGRIPAPPPPPSRGSGGPTSPQCDRRHRGDPLYCVDVISDIAEMYHQRERGMTRNAQYLATQVDINEKMRMILVDWLVDVHLKFKLHMESFFLAVDILDRYLAVSRTSRQALQLVGVTSMLIAAKYEEIFPPEVRDCIHISANTYTRDDILKMERAICSALQFKFTVPTPYPFLVRMLTVINADDTLRAMSFFFLEHSALDYKQLQFLPSQTACAALYLAQIALRREPWGPTLQHYSKGSPSSFRPCTEALHQFVQFSATTKYQAVRRKYATMAYGDIASRAMAVELPPV